MKASDQGVTTLLSPHTRQMRGTTGASSFLVGLLLAVASFAHAGPRASANYSIVTDSADAGGARATSAGYTNDGSAGGVTGLSTVASPAETAKSGYIGQLYEVTALQLAASPLTINETGTRQLSASQLLDDATTISVAGSSVTWSVLSGHVTGINSSGLATAGSVYQDTAASVQGSFAGLTGSLNLTVLDSIADNFGTYAGDGIGDDWQVQYFGQNNPSAAPGFVSDGSGLTNLFKYTAGLIPNNAASSFNLNVQPVTNQLAQKNIVFSPALSDRTYTIEFSATLAPDSWQTLTTLTNVTGTTTFTDTSAGPPGKFYRVQVTKP